MDEPPLPTLESVLLGTFDPVGDLTVYGERHSDPHEAVLTITHEDGHRQLSGGTTFGTLQTAIAFALRALRRRGLESGSPEGPGGAMGLLKEAAPLWAAALAASWNVHEGWATFRQRHLARWVGWSYPALPETYERAASRIDSICVSLPEPVAWFDYHVVYAFVSVAMNTRVLRDVDPRSLTLRRLEEHLRNATNVPDARLATLTDEIAVRGLSERCLESIEEAAREVGGSATLTRKVAASLCFGDTRVAYDARDRLQRQVDAVVRREFMERGVLPAVDDPRDNAILGSWWRGVRVSHPHIDLPQRAESEFGLPLALELDSMTITRSGRLESKWMHPEAMIEMFRAIEHQADHSAGRLGYIFSLGRSHVRLTTLLPPDEAGAPATRAVAPHQVLTSCGWATARRLVCAGGDRTVAIAYGLEWVDPTTMELSTEARQMDDGFDRRGVVLITGLVSRDAHKFLLMLQGRSAEIGVVGDDRGFYEWIVAQVGERTRYLLRVSTTLLHVVAQHDPALLDALSHRLLSSKRVQQIVRDCNVAALIAADTQGAFLDRDVYP